ncbi:hypothetical protein ACQUFT_00400 [Mammaliicoccus lentus]|uniref:hypothetical protein n=1 Tax=Mammaliicoccus TaxID=2803850 RepID=UPI000CD0D2BE|nr:MULTISPECIES: hypothetical protein [Mammaliicoccus]HBV04654.1 hypothetical protein [Staphylococcus sp.]MCJ0942377.1 hypothetical protein [Mammaliicoccus sciuri]POA03570.1 hypothetical protein CD135_10190 [Mammaliicoccus lentus]QMU10858.1 hypothetical protein H3V22_01075 [Mammaliicoccus lentus]WGZ43534.1 hypothetical protein PN942_01075 [Mammaliicoccus lentus]
MEQFKDYPKQRERVQAKEIFYANGIGFNINLNELVLNFDCNIPETEPKSISVVINPNALYSLREGINGMIDVYEEQVEEMKKNDGTQK